MRWATVIRPLVFLSLAACEIPPVDTTLISTEPASAKSFAVAQKAVRACKDLNDPDTVVQSFKRAGFGIKFETVRTRRGGNLRRTIVESPDEAVSVLLFGGSCYVGLVNMTPQQSSQLAQIWVDAFDAEPNSDFGDGLSDHVSGAWRRFFTEPAQAPTKAPYMHRIFIAAYKTWPYGPYDPQRKVAYDITGAFPDVPGAAVHLTHFNECKPEWYVTAPRNQFYLPCSGPAYRPK